LSTLYILRYVLLEYKIEISIFMRQRARNSSSIWLWHWALLIFCLLFVRTFALSGRLEWDRINDFNVNWLARSQKKDLFR